MKKNNKENEKFDDQVEGRNSVIELLESGRDINKIYISNGEKHGSINKIIELAKKRKVVISQVDRNKINQMSQTDNNQGVIAIVPPFDYCDVEDIYSEDGVVTVTAPSSEYGKIREALKAVTPEGKDFLEDTVSWVPLNPIELNTEKEKEQLQRLLDLLEEDDDVQDVYHNIVGLEPEEAEEE